MQAMLLCNFIYDEHCNVKPLVIVKLCSAECMADSATAYECIALYQAFSVLPLVFEKNPKRRIKYATQYSQSALKDEQRELNHEISTLNDQLGVLGRIANVKVRQGHFIGSATRLELAMGSLVLAKRTDRLYLLREKW